jgi:hypothetical protein
VTITLIPHDAGFFSQLNKVMTYLRYQVAKKSRPMVAVDWHIDRAMNPSFSYGCPEDGNIWTQFFEPLPPVPQNAFFRIRTSLFTTYSITSKFAYKMRIKNPQWREQYHRAWAEYIKVQPHILQRVNALYDAHLRGKFVVGVHVRNAFHSFEEPNRTAPSLELFIQLIQQHLPQDGREIAVYLATDVEEYIQQFAATFGERLVVQPDVLRARKTSVNRDEEIHTGVSKPGAYLGEQVLIDALLLSRGDVFVHSTSNISTAVGYINPKLKMVYCEEASLHS